MKTSGKKHGKIQQLTCLLLINKSTLSCYSFFCLFSAIPGYKIKIVGCFKENPAKKNIPTLLFSDVKGVNSKTKVDFKNFQQYIQGVVRRCATATKAKSLSFFAIGYIGKCLIYYFQAVIIL